MKLEEKYITTIDRLIELSLDNPKEFYEKIALNLAVEERLYLTQILEHKSCETCTNGACTVPTSEKYGLDELGEPEGSKCLGWINLELIGRSKILNKTDILELKRK